MRTLAIKREHHSLANTDILFLGTLEGEILRLLWDAQKPQSSIQIYEAMHLARSTEARDMQAPSTIAVTLSRMVEKGLLRVERRPEEGKGYYEPIHSRADVMIAVLNDVSVRLMGRSLRELLLRFPTEYGGDNTDGDLFALYTELQKLAGRNQPSLPRLDYALPQDVLQEYHALLTRKYTGQLTREQEIRLQELGQILDDADSETPLEQFIAREATLEHKERMATLDTVLAQLRAI